MRSHKAAAWGPRAGQHQARSHQRRAIGHAPAVDVEHGHHRHGHIHRAQAEEVRQIGGIAVQHDGPVGVEHAFGLAGGAGGVAQAHRLVLVEAGPVENGRFGANQALIGDHLQLGLERGVGHIGILAQHHQGPHPGRLQRWADGLGHRHLQRIHEQHGIGGIGDDVGDLGREQARVEWCGKWRRGRRGPVTRSQGAGDRSEARVPSRVPG